MQIKAVLLTLLTIAITSCAAAPHNDKHYEVPCHWYHKDCHRYCPHDTYKLTTGHGGCGNGQ